ncbi:hypothetical protein GIB67_031904 [Kingdonia uniflora]|uniref:Staygreen protein domain-containing protein n=1 Tax=Kingdonia uniflora TaxID=39325 RepID=A0A7J7NTH2_9MAGN|nr:hypothetical protein GIB67_031904 [Kingdonia uniflora]
MACCSSPKRDIFSKNKHYFSYSSRPTSTRTRPKTVAICSISERREYYNPIVFQAAKLLGPPTTFEASKLKVVFVEDEMEKYTGIVNPRTYTLSHCDLTADLTLAISRVINVDQLNRWYSRDDVVAEWKKVKEGMCLNIHCRVGGPNVLADLAAEFRYHIFTKELPLIYRAVNAETLTRSVRKKQHQANSCCMLREFKEAILGAMTSHPTMLPDNRCTEYSSKSLLCNVTTGKYDDSNDYIKIVIYAPSSSSEYNHVECWGPLREAAEKGKPENHEVKVSSTRTTTSEEVPRPLEKWGIPKSVFQSLVAFLL